MRTASHPLQVLLLTVSGIVNRHQTDVIAYLVEENRVLKEQLKGRRLRLSDDQRRRLAAKGKRIGRRALNRVATIVTPDTIMRWHRRLIAAKWTCKTRREGRPGLMKNIKSLIVRMATENPSWGYCRIQGELKGVGHKVASTTVANVLKDNGIKPAPDRPSSWSSFLVVTLIDSSGDQREMVRYSAYGVPVGIPGGDTGPDFVTNSTDVTQIQTWIDASTYDVRGDIDLNGERNTDDKTKAGASPLTGVTLGRGALSAFDNTLGYAGYVQNAALGHRAWHVRHRLLDSDLSRWTRRDPLGYADGPSLYSYGGFRISCG